MTITWFIVIVLGTLAVSKFYRLTPLHDTGSAIWHTTSPERERIAVQVFRKFVTRKTKDIGSVAVARTIFIGVMDIVNRTKDTALLAIITNAGVDAGRAFKDHNPHEEAEQLAAMYNVDCKLGEEVACVIYDPDPDLPAGYMAFVIIKDQSWMYIIRRHNLLMMITQMRHQRRVQKDQPGQTAA